MNGFEGFRVGKVSIYTRVFFFFLILYIRVGFGPGMPIPRPNPNVKRAGQNLTH